MIRLAFGEIAIAEWRSFSELEHRVVTRVADQQAVNQLVDRLRSSQVSLVGLSRRRLSLEDAYLEIVQAEAG